MKNIITLLLIILIFSSCEGYKYHTDQGKICSQLLDERSTARINNKTEQIPAIDVLFLKCGCDSLYKRK